MNAAKSLRREFAFKIFDIAKRRRLRIPKKQTKSVLPIPVRHQRWCPMGQSTEAVYRVQNARSSGVNAWSDRNGPIPALEFLVA